MSASSQRSSAPLDDTASTPAIPRHPHLTQIDPYLVPYESKIRERMVQLTQTERRLTEDGMTLADFAAGHEYFGLHFRDNEWIFREWAPNATAVTLYGDFSDWQELPQNSCRRISESGRWELRLPADAMQHTDHYKLSIHWPGGHGERIPTYARRVVQDKDTLLYSAQVWHPPAPYKWKHPDFTRASEPPLVYEAHVGMAQEEARIGSYSEFREKILPRVVANGYNTLQLMAIQEHPYYGSFGYHVSSLFAASSRFGTPYDLKELVDAAHDAGLAVVMDLVLSHAVRNEVEGLSRFDGTMCQFFHEGARGIHSAWDSCCFDYGKPEVLHFLLSNCRFWLDEYHFDGFRFDGVTSMLYRDHGLGQIFTGYEQYFSDNVDPDAVAFLGLANKVIHAVRPDAITIAEDVSGMPGTATPDEDGGIGFDYRLAMGTPDYWIKIIKEYRDEEWDVGAIYHELTNRRKDEKTIAYAESHDQALVGDQTLIFRLIGEHIYTSMSKSADDVHAERGIALHKMIRLITLTSAGHGYLNFMGNEFGHPEWIDFPRQGNNWSYHYARRQWSLVDDEQLKYQFLNAFDRDMLALCTQTQFLRNDQLTLRHQHRTDQVLAFERAGLIMVYNFNPFQSFTNYGIPCHPGKYILTLDSDMACYGGAARLSPREEHFSEPVKSSESGRFAHHLRLYLPTRTALVLRLE